MKIAGGPKSLTDTRFVPTRQEIISANAKVPGEGRSFDTARISRMRLMRVEELLTLGYTSQQIGFIVNEEFRKQGLPEVKHDTYSIDIKACKAAWADRIDTAREQLVAMQFNRYENVYRRSVEKDDIYAMIRVIESENKLLGLEAPKKVQVRSDLTIADITEERRQRAKEFFEQGILRGANGHREVIPASVSETGDGG